MQSNELLEEFNELVKDISVEVLETSMSKSILDSQIKIEGNNNKLLKKQEELSMTVQKQTKYLIIMSGVSIFLSCIILAIMLYIVIV